MIELRSNPKVYTGNINVKLKLNSLFYTVQYQMVGNLNGNPLYVATKVFEDDYEKMMDIDCSLECLVFNKKTCKFCIIDSSVKAGISVYDYVESVYDDKDRVLTEQKGVGFMQSGTDDVLNLLESDFTVYTNKNNKRKDFNFKFITFNENCIVVELTTTKQIITFVNSDTAKIGNDVYTLSRI